MAIKTIIRIEDEAGVGIYYSDVDTQCSSQMQEWDNNSSKRHPLPDDDDLLQREITHKDLPNSYNQVWRYGFANKEQCRFWIYKDEWLQELHEKGFRVVEVKCNNEDCAIGNTQAVYLDFVSKEYFDILSYFGLTEE